MNKKEIFELFDFMTSLNKRVFVDDLKYKGQADIKGFTITHPDAESNGLLSETTKKSIAFQSEWVLQANNISAEFRADGDLVKEINLGSLFSKETPVIITIGSESLRRVAPMFQRRSEVNDWIMLVHNYCQHRQEKGNPVPYWWEGQMLELAKFLYQNRAEKIEDRSIWAEMFV